MSDEEIFSDDDAVGGQELEVGQKVGFIPAVVLKVLKWVALGIAAIIFIVTVVIVTVNIMSPGRMNTVAPVASPEYQGPPPRLQWYAQIPQIRTSTADPTPQTLSVKVQIGYDLNDQKLQGELIGRTPRIVDIIRSYFREKTTAELSPQAEPVLKEELKERINRVLVEGKIKEVTFEEFLIF